MGGGMNIRDEYGIIGHFKRNVYGLIKVIGIKGLIISFAYCLRKDNGDIMYNHTWIYDVCDDDITRKWIGSTWNDKNEQETIIICIKPYCVALMKDGKEIEINICLK